MHVNVKDVVFLENFSPTKAYSKETHQEINLRSRKIHSKKLLKSLYFNLLQLFLAKINP